jgi:hypothetical protein
MPIHIRGAHFRSFFFAAGFRASAARCEAEGAAEVGGTTELGESVIGHDQRGTKAAKTSRLWYSQRRLGETGRPADFAYRCSVVVPVGKRSATAVRAADISWATSLEVCRPVRRCKTTPPGAAMTKVG